MIMEIASGSGAEEASRAQNEEEVGRRLKPWSMEGDKVSSGSHEFQN